MPSGVSALLLAAAVFWLPEAVLAQGSACDQLKVTLAARIEATGVRGYSLEAVPASTPVPAGAKAIGNCEGGALKILYRRFGGTSSAASAPVVAQEPPPPKRQAPPARAEVLAPVASSVPTPKPAPVPAPAPEPVKAEPVRPKVAEPVPVVEPVPPPAAPAAPAASTLPAEPEPPTPPWWRRVSGFAVTRWQWLLALLVVPLIALGWAWRAHHLAYDKNGLPRGPRL